MSHYDALETRDPAARERELSRACRRDRACPDGAGLGAAACRRRPNRHLARGAGEAAAAAQVRSAGAAEGTPAVRRLQRHAARQSASACSCRPDRSSSPKDTARISGGAARALFAAGFRPGDIVHNSLLLSSDARRLHPRSRRACARLRGHSRRHRQHRAAARRHRPLPAERLYRHAGFSQDPARHCGRRPARTRPRSSAALVSGAALPASLRQELASRGVTVLQCYAIAETRRDRLRERGARRA